ncbi:fatty acyl-AMP ligase [Parafrankia sp. EUN1f]|uniref:fatty acyl-AMP ligase n=1 Tax=Parafrankia sp. EUN1f TaxID=102897 RepID=UPI0001C43A57|nr:fatty acyl-AMP ligase [Parafrankia sp. EUN1f]EFC84316.1 AMP-dependent synthetase and ligase [Parafrankia sp. EUN1f]
MPGDEGTLDAAGALIRARTLDEHLSEQAAARPDDIAMSFVDYGTDRSGVETSTTFGQLDAAVSAAAWQIAQAVPAGGRMVILSPQGLGYVIAFLGALRAGVVAVPLFPPDLIGHSDRLTAVFDDCVPSCVATTTSVLPSVRAYLETRAQAVAICVIDGPGAPSAGPGEPAEPAASAAPAEPAASPVLPVPPGWAPAGPRPGLDDVAYIQYTSGSTRTPSGVLVTHGNIVANTAQAMAGYRCHPARNTVVSWLPLFHDMGLVLVVGGTVAGGVRSVLLDPVAFLQRPGRWLRHLAENRGAVAMAPNFAFDFAVDRVRPKEREGLRLDDVWVLGNGSEPVRPATLERFLATFGPLGLRPEALCPSYGLAEATVYVCGGASGRPQRPVWFDAEALAAGRAMPVDESERPAQPGIPQQQGPRKQQAPRPGLGRQPGQDPERSSQQGPVQGAPQRRLIPLLSCGVPAGQRVAVVDPQAGRLCPPDVVGEIWVRGPNVARGYFNQPARSEATFGQRLAAPAGERTAVLPAGWSQDGWQDDGWLRTGDLGMVHEGALYVTGRLKDLIVIDGRNHYPQDIEATVEAAHEAVRPSRAAAFTVSTDHGEAVVVAAEITAEVAGQAAEVTRIAGVIRGAVAVSHGVAVREVVLTRPGTIPLTSSGKIARHACRERYLAGAFAVTGASR